MSALLEKQQEFFAATMKLGAKALAMGYKATWGDCYRDARVTYGHPKSTHRSRLAVDINLFIDGRLIEDEEGHTNLHRWAEENLGFSPMIKGDERHYSFEYMGVR